MSQPARRVAPQQHGKAVLHLEQSALNIHSWTLKCSSVPGWGWSQVLCPSCPASSRSWSDQMLLHLTACELCHVNHPPADGVPCITSSPDAWPDSHLHSPCPSASHLQREHCCASGHAACPAAESCGLRLEIILELLRKHAAALPSWCNTLTPPRRCTQARRTLQAINPHKLSPKQWREEEAASKRSLASLHTSAEVRCLNNWLCCHV